VRFLFSCLLSAAVALATLAAWNARQRLVMAAVNYVASCALEDPSPRETTGGAGQTHTPGDGPGRRYTLAIELAVPASAFVSLDGRRLSRDDLADLDLAGVELEELRAGPGKAVESLALVRKLHAPTVRTRTTLLPRELFQPHPLPDGVPVMPYRLGEED
jgi:hypothetical protein